MVCGFVGGKCGGGMGWVGWDGFVVRGANC